MTPEIRAQLLHETKGSAAALIEDMQHIREVLARSDPLKGEVRRLSAILRRLLVERDIGLIAAPRVGRIRLRVPDNSLYYKAESERPYAFFGSAGVEAFGARYRAVAIYRGAVRDEFRRFSTFNPDATALVRIDGFLSQKVLCLEENWCSREDVIKYLAHVASGVHSGTAKEPKAVLLERIRRVATYSRQGGIPNVNFNLGAFKPGDLGIAYDPDSLDVVLYELLAAAHYLADSEELSHLETLIVNELRGPSA